MKKLTLKPNVMQLILIFVLAGYNTWYASQNFAVLLPSIGYTIGIFIFSIFLYYVFIMVGVNLFLWIGFFLNKFNKKFSYAVIPPEK